MRSIAEIELQYSHRFLNYEGEAQYLHGHSGHLTIEVGGKVDERTGFVFPCGDIKKIAWSYLMNFDHALIMQENDPILPEIKKVYENQGIINGCETNTMLGEEFDTPLAKAYPKARLVVVKKVATCENLIEVFYELLKDKMNIKKMTFTSGTNAACCEF